MEKPDLEKQIRDAGLKVTPQRINVLELLYKSNHPTADFLIDKIKEKFSSVSSGTIYHILDVFSEKGLIRRVYTRKGVMRYDAILANHHHLHEEETDRIEDYFDDELFELIKKHFEKNPVEGFELKDIKVKLMGKFNQ
jgi:Fur family peroxide stress response transcriptional regulator